MFLSIDPLSLVPLPTWVGVDSVAMLSVFVPFALICCSTTIAVDPLAMLLAVLEPAFMELATSIDIDAFSCKFILFPGAHVAIFVDEGVDARPASKVLVVPDVFPSIRVRDLLVLTSEFPTCLEELGQELLPE